MKDLTQRRNALICRFPQWRDLTVAGLHAHITSQFPDRPMIITPERTLTYHESQLRSRAIAAGLIALGLQVGDCVALIMANFPEFVLTKLAIAQAGCIAVPFNFLLTAQEMHYVLEQSGCRALIGMTQFRGRDYEADFVTLKARLPDLDHIVLHENSAPQSPQALSLTTLADSATAQTHAEQHRREAAANAHDTSDIIYTSGTTGYPKGAVLTHDMLLRAAFSSALTRAFEDGRRIQFALPLYHVFSYVECWLAAMFVGGAIIPHTAFDAAEMLNWAERLGSTDIVCVPVMTQMLVAQARTRPLRAPKLISVFNSGGPTDPAIWQDIRDVLRAREMHTAYGMTETTASTMCTRSEDPEERLIDTNGRYKLAGPAGDPSLSGRIAEYRVVDPKTGAAIPLGASGELQVRGPVVTREYYCNPQETAEAFTDDGWFRTGDIGCLQDGGYLKLTGRLKEAYRCGGEMVMPREIEMLCEALPGVAQALAIGIPDPKMGEVGCLCVVASPSARPDPAQIIAHCAANLAKFKVPRHVIVLEPQHVPMTATGRPQKHKLREYVMKFHIHDL